jgi:hypothetical protein
VPGHPDEPLAARQARVDGRAIGQLHVGAEPVPHPLEVHELDEAHPQVGEGGARDPAALALGLLGAERDGEVIERAATVGPQDVVGRGPDGRADAKSRLRGEQAEQGHHGAKPA